MTVVNLSDFRPPETKPVPHLVSFFGPVHRTGAPLQMYSLELHVRIENGDYNSVIRIVRENGGVWVKMADGSAGFLAWPCAAVYVKAVD